MKKTTNLDEYQAEFIEYHSHYHNKYIDMDVIDINHNQFELFLKNLNLSGSWMTVLGFSWWWVDSLVQYQSNANTNYNFLSYKSWVFYISSLFVLLHLAVYGQAMYQPRIETTYFNQVIDQVGKKKELLSKLLYKSTTRNNIDVIEIWKEMSFSCHTYKEVHDRLCYIRYIIEKNIIKITSSLESCTHLPQAIEIKKMTTKRIDECKNRIESYALLTYFMFFRPTITEQAARDFTRKYLSETTSSAATFSFDKLQGYINLLIYKLFSYNCFPVQILIDNINLEKFYITGLRKFLQKKLKKLCSSTENHTSSDTTTISRTILQSISIQSPAINASDLTDLIYQYHNIDQTTAYTIFQSFINKNFLSIGCHGLRSTTTSHEFLYEKGTYPSFNRIQLQDIHTNLTSEHEDTLNDYSIA